MVPSSGNVGAAEDVDQTFLRYGARTVPLDANNNAVVVPNLADVASVFDIQKKSIRAGDFDQSLAQLAQRNKKLSEARNAADL